MGEYSKRQKFTISNIRTYFFSELLDHIITNKNNLKDVLAKYVIGISDDCPLKKHILEWILGKNDVKAALDTLYVLGQEYFEEFQGMKERFSDNHDILEVLRASSNFVVFEKNVASLCRKMMVQKCEDAPILLAMFKIVTAKNNIDKLDACLELCSLDLDWDAYVLIKILGLNTEERAEEMNFVWEAILEKLNDEHSDLVNMIRCGPVVDPDTVIMKLLSKPNGEGLEEAAGCLIEKLEPFLNISEENSLEERSIIVSQLFNLIISSFVANKGHIPLKFLNSNIEKVMFYGMEKYAFKSSIFLSMQMIQMFLPENPRQPVKYEDWEKCGIYENLNNELKRDALLRILQKYHMAALRQIFGCSTYLNSQFDDKIKNVNEIVATAIKLAIWIVTYYDKEFSIESKREIAYFEQTEIERAMKKLQDFAEISSQVIRTHISRICCALRGRKDVENDVRNLIYSKEEIKKVSLNIDERVKTIVSEGIEETNSADLMFDDTKHVKVGVTASAIRPIEIVYFENKPDMPKYVEMGEETLKKEENEISHFSRNSSSPVASYDELAHGDEQSEQIRPTTKFAYSGFGNASTGKVFGNIGVGFGNQLGSMGGSFRGSSVYGRRGRGRGDMLNAFDGEIRGSRGRGFGRGGRF